MAKQLTADERTYMEANHLDYNADYDFESDPHFNEWMKSLTDNCLDGVFPRRMDVENVEVLQYIWKHETLPLQIRNATLYLFDPINEINFNECRRDTTVGDDRNEVRKKENIEYKEPGYYGKESICCNYFLNNITSLEAIMNTIKNITDHELLPYKLSFDFGFIIEDTKEETYEKSRPKVENLCKQIPMLIRSPNDIQLFKQLVFTTLGQLTSEIHTIKCSRYHYVAVHSMLFQVSRMKNLGARVLVPGFDFLIKNKYIRDFGNNNNICLFNVIANCHPKHKTPVK